MRGRKCWGGLDLASTRDFCALVWVFPPEGDERHYTVLPRLWWPKLSMQAAAQKSRVPFHCGVAQPHDHLFRLVFGDPEHAVPLLRSALPPAVAGLPNSSGSIRTLSPCNAM